MPASLCSRLVDPHPPGAVIETDGLWMFVLAWLVIYWGVVFVLGGLLAWLVARRAVAFLVGGVVSVALGAVLWSPLVSLDSGTALTVGWVAAVLVGLMMRWARRGPRGTFA